MPNTTNPDDWARASGRKGERITSWGRWSAPARCSSDHHVPRSIPGGWRVRPGRPDPRLGIETEYGILAPDAPELGPAALSAAVVAAHAGPATGTALDWVEEIPIEDAHNRVLSNGARLYVDHAHPEYSGPEVTSAREAVAYDLAGDADVAAARPRPLRMGHRDRYLQEHRLPGRDNATRTTLCPAA